MTEKKYDIFISYRREDGAQYARILQLELEKYNYRVFLDYEELTDGVFGEDISKAIRSASIFIMVLTPHYLERTMEADSWVTKEIRLANECNCHFIPVDPDRKFDGIPSNTPQDIGNIVSQNQHSSIDFGQALRPTVDMMVKNRIVPYVPLPKPKRKRRLLIFSVVALVALCALGYLKWQQHKADTAIAGLKASCEASAQEIVDELEQPLNWSPELTLPQARAICSIIENMVLVEGGSFMQGAAPNDDGTYDDLVCVEVETPQIAQTVETFFICKYEVSVAEWGNIMGEPFADEEAMMPKTQVSFEEGLAFAQKLTDLTGFTFNLPTEPQWEYAARGGREPDGTIFAGSDNPKEVAWFGKSATSKPHICDATNLSIACNSLDLYDMSGNVAEWCSTPFRPYHPDVIVPDDKAVVVRGGYYDSEPYELTVYHREPMNPAEKANNVGLRLVITNEQ